MKAQSGVAAIQMQWTNMPLQIAMLSSDIWHHKSLRSLVRLNCPSASNWNISDRKAVFLQPYRFVLFFPISICFRFHVRNVCLQYEWRSELRKNFFLKIYVHRFHFFRQLASDWLTNKAPVHKASHDFYLMTECPWDVRSISKQQILSADGHGVRVTWHRFSTVQKRGEKAFFGNCA